MQETEALLQRLQIPFERHEHPPMHSVHDAGKIGLSLPGAHTKQLLLTEKKGDRVIMAIVMHDKRLDVSTFAKTVGTKSLSFASPDTLMDLLHVTPGSVTPFGLIFDEKKRIEIMIDEDAWAIGTFQFHPMINTATLIIDRDGLKTFLAHTGHNYSVMPIPHKEKTA